MCRPLPDRLALGYDDDTAHFPPPQLLTLTTCQPTALLTQHRQSFLSLRLHSLHAAPLASLSLHRSVLATYSAFCLLSLAVNCSLACAPLLHDYTVPGRARRAASSTRFFPALYCTASPRRWLVLSPPLLLAELPASCCRSSSSSSNVVGNAVSRSSQRAAKKSPSAWAMPHLRSRARAARSSRSSKPAAVTTSLKGGGKGKGGGG